jgi:serine protease Do
MPLRCAILSIALVLSPQVLQADVATEVTLRQKQLSAALQKVKDTVVGVSDGFGVGSGVIVSSDGLVLTASHVVQGGTRRRRASRNVFVTLPDGSRFRADVLGRNYDADAAMLRIIGEPASRKALPYAELGESGKLALGEWCFALGHPGGISETRSAPVRVGRVLSVGDRTVITDCSIVLGDSGGPLFDLNGRVIGIHSMITSLIIENRHAAIDAWQKDWDRFVEGDSWGRLRNYDNQLVETPFFGVDLRWKDFRPEVSKVTPESPADKAGLRPGDQLLEIAGERFADRLDLGTVLAQLQDEQNIDVIVYRDEDVRTVAMVTGHRDDGDDRRRRRLLDEDERNEIEEQLSPSRRIGPYEKRSSDQLKLLKPGIASARQSVVSIRDGGLLLCLGTVVSSDGYILTKASELSGAIDPECILANGRRYSAREIGVDHSYDLALLKISASGLKPVKFRTSKPAAAGQLAVIQDSRGNALIPTVVSVANRKLAGSGKGFVGVHLSDDRNGVRITGVLPGGAAERGGLRKNDLVKSINGITMRDPDQMINKVKQYSPGEKLVIRFERDDSIRSLELVLTARFVNEDAMLELYRDIELMGQFASTHSGGFPDALQIDADIYPRQTGGPLLDLEGNAIGINIARSARVVSYAIPADAAQRVFQSLKKGRQKDAR